MIGSDCRACPRRQIATIYSLPSRSMRSTVTGTPSTVVSKGTARFSSVIVSQPVICSESPWASTVACSRSFLRTSRQRGRGLSHLRLFAFIRSRRVPRCPIPEKARPSVFDFFTEIREVRNSSVANGVNSTLRQFTGRKRIVRSTGSKLDISRSIGAGLASGPGTQTTQIGFAKIVSRRNPKHDRTVHLSTESVCFPNA